MIGSSKKQAFAFCAALFITNGTLAANITGAGASFPAPIYAKWADAYYKATGSRINYQSIGSGGGIRQIKAKTVDFGASDAPLKPSDLEKNALQQFPAVIGGIVLIVNIPDIKAGDLKLTGSLLADIYLGKIQKWNDQAIAELNPDLQLPDKAIAVIRRADGSGTTSIFTNYLAKISPEWKNRIGEGSAVQWPAGIGGKGNEGVAAFVQRLSGAIGYVESAYARQSNFTTISLQNQAGFFVQPTEASFRAAAMQATWDSDTFYTMITDQPGSASWPIIGATFILIHKIQDNPSQAIEILNFFDWAYRNGGKMAEDLDYVPLPAETVELIKASWSSLKSKTGAALITQ